jgi:hypothetical protein
MTVLGFHASHEQVHPAALLEAVQHAEQVGFTVAMRSDHFSPWSVRQGHSDFAWSWLGAALEATDLPFGVVNAPGHAKEQSAWLDVFGEQVLPQLDVTQKAAA